nr:hypothetical protein BaRGS_024042 [Batillaria attramentaria]
MPVRLDYYLRPNSNMFAELGTLVGVFVCGFIADRFGRKITFYIAGLALMCGGFGIAFTYSLLTLNICRFLLGVARMAVWTNSLIIGLEIVGPSRRTFAGLFIDFLWCGGEFLLLLLAYFIRDWRWLEIALSVPAVGLLFYWKLIPESPRWLASRGRDDEAMKVLERIAKSNNTQLPKVEDAHALLEGENNLGLHHVFRSRELIKRTFIVLVNMFVLVLLYYGLTLNITNLSGDIFVNFAINVALETVAYVTTYLVVDRLGRKPVYSGSLILAGALCVTSALPVMLSAPGSVVTVLSSLGRFFVCISFALIYLYGAELFPTVVRSSAMSFGVTFSRIGNMIAPYIADVDSLE